MKSDKSVFVIDTPKSCGECPLKDLEEKWMCNLTDEIVSVDCEKPRPISCPLRPLPEKKESDFEGLTQEDYESLFPEAEGWNKCLEAITGEAE